MSKVASYGTADTVVWFTSLRIGEIGVTRRIHEELLPLLDANRIRHEVIEPASADAFLFAMDGIAARTGPDGIRPILHFDMHGSAATGLRIVATGEDVLWATVSQRMQAINVRLGNDLFVVSTACFSLQVALQASITEPCPYYVLVAPEETVTAGMLEDNVADFYREMFRRNDFMAAYQAYLAPTFKLFHSERLLFLALAKYIRNHCMGAGLARRREELMDHVVAAGLSPGKDMRAAIKDGIAADQALVDKFVDCFLMGKAPAFGIDDVTEYIRQDMAGANRLLARKSKEA
jgi:hypothetical protein